MPDTPSSVRCQLLFVTASRDTLAVDAALVDPLDHEHPACSLLQLRVRRPSEEPLGSAVPAVLHQWTDGRPVTATFRSTKGAPRVRLSSAATTVLLDLEQTEWFAAA